MVCRPCVWRACGATACATWWWCTATGARTPRRTSCWEWTSPARRGRSELAARQDGLSGSTKLALSSWLTCTCTFQQEKGHRAEFSDIFIQENFQWNQRLWHPPHQWEFAACSLQNALADTFAKLELILSPSLQCVDGMMQWSCFWGVALLPNNVKKQYCRSSSKTNKQLCQQRAVPFVCLIRAHSIWKSK